MCVILSDKSEDKDFLYGGQAVIEGVMMRGKDTMAVAVRKPDKEITVNTEELNTFLRKYKFLNKPLIRGPFVLIDAFRMGIKALFISARESFGEEEAQKELGLGAVVSTFLIAFLVGIGLFIILPTYLTNFLKTNPFLLNFVEGFVRMVIFLLYIIVISRLEDIKRVFQYHGAEHKVIYTYEAGKELTVENARTFSCLHPRCGTSFIIMVLLLSILLHALWGWPDLWLRIVSRLIMLPIIAAIAYEMTRLAGKNNPFFRLLVLPGVWLQVFTTREPSDDQLEVAIKALERVLPEFNSSSSVIQHEPEKICAS